MNALARGLTWPVVTVLIVGATHLVAEMLRPQLATVIGPAVVVPIYLAAGGWAGHATVRAGGTFAHGLVASAALGLLPLGLQLVGFGLMLGRDPELVATLGVFGLAAVFWGGAFGSGIAASRPVRSSPA